MVSGGPGDAAPAALRWGRKSLKTRDFWGFPRVMADFVAGTGWFLAGTGGFLAEILGFLVGTGGFPAGRFMFRT